MDDKTRASLPDLKYSTSESNRFNMRIFRCNSSLINIDTILTTIFQKNIDILILRIPSEEISHISKVDKYNIPYIVADTLVYYCCDLEKYTPNNLKNNDLDFVKCELEEHKLIIGSLVEEIFLNYKNHYFSNEFLNKENILEGYKEWAASYVLSQDEKKVSWLIKRHDRYIGFATCSYMREAEGILYGVIPSESGGGVYGDIIRFTQQYFKNEGFSKMLVSTQVHNYAVQKVWTREGFYMNRSYKTIHINSFSDISVVPIKNIELKTAENIALDIEQINYNLDNDLLDYKYIEKDMIDVVLTNIKLINYYLSEYPGEGTTIVSYNYNVLKSLESKGNYFLRISFPFIDELNGLYKSLVKIVDRNGDLYLYIYIDLHKKGEIEYDTL